MFSKATKAAPAGSESTATRRPSVASLIAPGVRITGDVETTGDLQLDGELVGDVRVEHLCLGETGVLTGSIAAESVEIRGRVIGSIHARHVRLCATAMVDGDVSHVDLAIEAGAHFEGRSHILPAQTEETAQPETALLTVVAG